MRHLIPAALICAAVAACGEAPEGAREAVEVEEAAVVAHVIAGEGEGALTAPFTLVRGLPQAEVAHFEGWQAEAEQAAGRVIVAPAEAEIFVIEQGRDAFGASSEPGSTTAPPTTAPSDEIAPGDLCTLRQQDFLGECSSHRPGSCAIEAHFDLFYPEGMKVTRGVQFELSSAEAFIAATPARGKAEALQSDTFNPAAESANRLAMELAVLKLNMDFSAGGKLGAVPFGDLKIDGGPLAGYTVRDVAQIAQWILSGETYLAHTLGADVEGVADMLARLNGAGADCQAASYIGR